MLPHIIIIITTHQHTHTHTHTPGGIDYMDRHRQTYVERAAAPALPCLPACLPACLPRTRRRRRRAPAGGGAQAAAGDVRLMTAGRRSPRCCR